MAADLARLGGPVRKQSAWMKNWRARWLKIDGDRLTFYSEDRADGGEIGFDDSERTALPWACVLRRPTLAIDLASITAVFAVPDERFRRLHSFVLCVRGGSEMIALQAPDEEQRSLWLQVIPSAQAEAARRLEASRAQAMLAEAEKVVDAHDKPSASPSAIGKGKGKCTPPPPPCKGKGKSKDEGEDSKPSKGKGKAPAPLPKAATKAKGKGKALPVLAANKRLQLRGMDDAIDLNQTVFGAMLDDNGGVVSGSSLDDESGTSRMAEMFRETFTPRGVGDRARKASIAIETKRSQHQKAILDRVVAQNAEIVLRRLPISVEEFKDAIESLDFNVVLTDDILDRLREALPAEPMFKRLLQFKDEEAELRQIEQKLLRLAPVSRVDSRLRAISLKKGLAARRCRLLDDVNLVRAACSELMESRALREILQAVLRVYNFANHGVERLESGSARGFDITTALKVADLKAEVNNHSMGGRFNGLHFVVSQVLIQNSHRSSEDLRTELKSIFKASNLNLGEISREARTLHGEAQFLIRELTEHRACYESESCENEPAENPEVSTLTLPLPAEVVSTTPLPKLPPVSEECTDKQHEESTIIVASPRRMRTRFGRKASKMMGCLDVGSEGVAWIAEIQGRRLWKSRRVRWRRMFIDASSHSLVIRGWQSRKSLPLRGANIEPFSSTRASPEAAALSREFPYGFEVSFLVSTVEAGYLPFEGPYTLLFPRASRKNLHLTCASPDELEWWLDSLRRQASSGSLELEPSQTTDVRSTPVADCAISKGSEEGDMSTDSESDASTEDDSGKASLRTSADSSRKSVVSRDESIIVTNSDKHSQMNQIDTEPSLSAVEPLVGSDQVSLDFSVAESDTETSTRAEGPRYRPPRRFTLPVLALSGVDAVPRLNLKLVASESDDPCPRQSVGLAMSSTETIDSSEDDVSNASSEAEGDDAEASPDQLPTAKQSVAQKLEILSEEVANVEVEVQSKVREAAFQAAQVMKYFGQTVPPLEDGLESLDSLGRLLKDFLASVNSFLVRVDVSWRELERSQQQKAKRQVQLKVATDEQNDSNFSGTHAALHARRSGRAMTTG